MKKIKVCHITSVHSRYDARIFYKECSSLAERYEVILLCADNGKSEVLNGVSIKAIKDISNRWIRIFTSTSRMLKVAKKVDADIYHFHDPELLGLGLKLKKYGKIVIYDAHENVPDQILNKHWIPIKLRKIVSFCVKYYEDYCVKRLDAVITATETIAKRFKGKSKKRIIIHNYPILQEFEEKGMEEKVVKENAICFAGSISEDYGIKKVITAINQIDIKLYLAGTLRGDMEQYIEENNFKGNIEYLGFLNRKQVYELYQKCKAGIVTYLPIENNVDGLPTKMFEYMNAGLPVIVSDFPIMGKIVKDSQCGILVNPNDVFGISEAIQKLVNDTNKQELYGENGRKAVREHYSWEREKERLYYFYDKICDNEK